jgi:putative Mg2+ transporter-C (MgtC) family protein
VENFSEILLIPEIDFTVKLLIAAVIGLLIGYERTGKGWAGLRTQMLICCSATLLSTLSIHLVVQYASDSSLGVRINPTDLMAPIITGVGFIGAGAILKSGVRVIGVTTAATIWATAAIGITVGAGYYFAALVATLIVLSIEPIARIQRASGSRTFPFLLTIAKDEAKNVSELLNSLTINVKRQNIDHNNVELTIMSTNRKNEELIELLDNEKIKFEFRSPEE